MLRRNRKRVPSSPVDPKEKQDGFKSEILNGIQKVIAALCSKISSVSNAMLKNTLNIPFHDTVRNKQRVSCLDNNDITGVVGILEKWYGKVPMTLVFESLRDLFKDNSGLTHQQVVAWINVKVGLWAEFEFFNYLTLDILFAFLTISNLKGTGAGSVAFQAVTQHLRANQDDYTHERISFMRGASNEMVLLRKVNEVISDDAIYKKKIEDTKAKGFNRAYRPKSTNYVSGEVQANMASAAPAPAPNSAVDVNGEYTREHNRWARNVVSGRDFPYTSTKEICAKCESSEPHQPKCYMGQCSRCRLFGHPISQCGRSK